MAKTDPDRVRRIIAGLKEPGEQACAWALLAAGLADRDKPAARSALTESIQVIDRLLNTARAVERLLAHASGIATNPAASILPIVEKVAPDASKRSSGEPSPSCRKTTQSAWVLPVPDPRVPRPSSWLVTTVKRRTHCRRKSTRSCDPLPVVALGTFGISSGPRPLLTRRAPWRSSRRFPQAVRIGLIRRIETGSSWRPGWRNPPEAALEARLA